MSAFPIVDGVTVAIPPPEGYVVNFEHPLQRHAIESYVISGIGTTLSFLFFFQYLYVKLWVLRKPDGETGSFILGVTGVHAWELPLEKFNEGNQARSIVKLGGHIANNAQAHLCISHPICSMHCLLQDGAGAILPQAVTAAVVEMERV
ncbi:hypothetical protein LB503_003213 [Fusarium chuoi]|nr:hypothetical protein LB503_003213 [Fusarium chuoi]